MSLRIVIDDRELASRLAEMGYENLPPELLRALKKDIKKLVKHDITLGKSTSRELSPAVAPQYVSSSSSSEASSTSVQRPRVTEATVQTERIFHHSSSDASLSSTTPSEACIRAQLAGLAPLTWPRHCCTRDDDDDFDSVSPPKMKRSSSAPTFRVAKAKKLQKNDPVSLYHNYRKDWDKFNIPGAKGAGKKFN
ncbi:unnamed protein product [Notodromas monacha]|uniref:Uncharacterized protein n=1 Tax=Notodromas monacha TaxID=399045 RepID=A0A7R9BDS9_9CRUS|nr:unnamed protein product [Notodromas monacha]CAG0912803.1 unnamed protein product [Notodromas monacha]